MIIIGNNVCDFKRDARKSKYFTIYDSSNFGDVYKRAINYKIDIDGLLVEHKAWYQESVCTAYDSRLYIIVKGFDDVYYAVSFKDYIRKDNIIRFDGLHDTDFVETKIIKAETMFDDYVLAKVDNIVDSISPGDPLNIYKLEHLSEEEEDNKSHSYSIEGNALIALKLLIGIDKLRKEGINKIVISADEKVINTFNEFYIKFYFRDVKKSKYVPRHLTLYVDSPADLVMCNPVVAKKYEEHGYKLLEIKPKYDYESILSRRLEGRR